MRIDRKRFYQQFRPYFREVTGGNVTPAQIKNLEFLLDAFERSEWFSADVRRMAYALATIHIETYLPKTNSRYAPVREGGGKAYFIRRYWTNTKIRKQLGNKTEEDAWRRCGRGYVQETGLANDIKFTELTGIDFVSDPDLAMVPANALKIMEVGMIRGTWTGRKIGDYIGQTTDYKGARRVINGQDRAAEIAGYARNFEHFLRDAISASGPVSETHESLTENAAGDTTSAVAGDNPHSTAPEPTLTETTKQIETGPEGTSASIEEKTTSFSPDPITQYIPKMKGVRNWFATLSLGGIASTTWAAFNGLPPWAIFVLGMVTMGVVIGFVFIVVRYRANLFDLVKHVISVNADPTTNNVVLVAEK